MGRFVCLLEQFIHNRIVPANPLESARAKIDRAKYHLSQLQDEIKADANEKYGVRFRHEQQSGDLVMKAIISRELFVHYSIITGEIISHARSALEHAVWEITPVSDRHRRTGFPVFRFEIEADRITGGEGYYDRDGLRMLRGVNLKAQAIIKAVQPFGPDYQTSLLYILNELWNTDKHRLLNFCAVYPGYITVNYMPLPLGSKRFSQRFVSTPADIKDGTELFREPFNPNVKVAAENWTKGVVFDGGIVDGKPVPELLLKLIEFAEGVIDGLAGTI